MYRCKVTVKAQGHHYRIRVGVAAAIQYNSLCLNHIVLEIVKMISKANMIRGDK